MADLRLRAELAVRGVRMSAPVHRHGGAGPTGDGHLLVGGHAAAVPLDPDSPYTVAAGVLHLDGEPLDVSVSPVSRPRFYDEVTTDGVPMHRLARLHGSDVLATTVVQTCVRYQRETRCRYCSIEESLSTGVTTRVKAPGQLAEVATAAVALDGVRQMVMTTGTAASADRGARHLARCTRAVKAAVPALPIQVQCEPPADLASLADLRGAGADTIGIHVESLDDGVRSRWLPGKAEVPLSAYWEAWDEAVRLFGRNQVSTYLLVGLGEDTEELIAGAERLIAHGVYPFVVPVRPGTATLAVAEGLRSPPAELVATISERVAALLGRAEMRGSDQAAGCAACGACSALGAATESATAATESATAAPAGAGAQPVRLRQR